MNLLYSRTFGKNWHAGFWTTGQCWKFRFRVFRYHTCVFYTFWRFYLSIDR